MGTPAYMLGALDALVKSGAVSADYAAGVVDVLVKDAWFASSPNQNFKDLLDEWRAEHPGEKMTREAARDIVLRSRPWYYRAFRPNAGWGEYLGNRWDKIMAAIKSTFGQRKYPTGEQYDTLLEDRENLELRRFADENLILDNEVSGALQDEFVRVGKQVVKDAKKYMPEIERNQWGYDDDWPSVHRTRQGTMALRGGFFKPEYDTESVTTPEPDPPRGKPLPDSYGDNKKLFSRIPYMDPFVR